MSEYACCTLSHYIAAFQYLSASQKLWEIVSSHMLYSIAYNHVLKSA